MKIAFVIYDGMTTLDFIGVYDPLTRLKTMGFRADVEWDTCAVASPVLDVAGLSLQPSRVREPLGRYDMAVVPGGIGARRLVADAEFVEWLKTAAPCQWKVSVCTGALLLGAAGFLHGRTATTHPGAREELRPYVAAVSEARIVDEGDVITAGGVTASIDLGLYLCEKLAGKEVRERIQRQMDYAGG
jgi:cyclohexyl-isocyanide hydratase